MRKMKNSVIKKFVLFFSIFLVLILALLSLLNIKGERALRESLDEIAVNQVLYMKNRLTETVREAEIYGAQYLSEDNIRYYQSRKVSDSYLEQLLAKELILTRFQDQLLASRAIEGIAVYWPETREAVSSPIDMPTIYPFAERKEKGWHVIDGSLYFFLGYPYQKSNIVSRSEYIIIVKLSDQYLDEIVDKVSVDEKFSGLFLTDNGEVLSNTIVDEQVVKEVATKWENGKEIQSFYYQDSSFVMTKIPRLNLSLITYMDSKQSTTPIDTFNLIFSINLLVITLYGIFLIYKFDTDIYKQVQTLSTYLGIATQGDYVTRIETIPNNEFGTLFQNFNEMSENTQTLIMTLQKENELRKNAEMKQMQAQIDPHFLYNNFSYIVSMAHMNADAVEEMALYLAEYYQSITTSTHQTVTVESELKMIDAYLHIMSLRKDITFSIDVAEELKKQEIVPLIFQPLVENAIVHGIEARQGAERISIHGKKVGREWVVEISDDGFGMDEKRIKEIYTQINASSPPLEDHGVGLWNVNQRLINILGEASRLQFVKNDWGGTTVRFLIKNAE
ncbi:histidine kinase [Jeotgalibaca sp. MA1X17-3]|uniref:sensor histidine kinase n=1 Tax=Jeotgalibaca sp. MA1X17-3 TaxID=2908211 RepID=UPI001F182CDF|nr:histidine kinase [Jeotgalibaca sp. MA1X17-3]UJF15604.1 histidine kinase [Jeotgalibaca sp. MA1X17-3]